MSTFRHFFLKPWLYAVIVVLGIGLKFYQLNSKLFWGDEIASVLYTSGLKGDIIQESILVNQIKSFAAR